MFEFLSDREKLIFLSGIFEGEGHFGNHKAGKYKDRQKYLVEAIVEMVDEDVIQKFHEFFECGTICKPTIRHNYKQTYRWKVSGVEALKVIHKMLPYLGKRRQEKYYGMVQSIRDGSKDGSAYILKPSKDKTSNVGCSINACTKDGSGRGSLSGQTPRS